MGTKVDPYQDDIWVNGRRIGPPRKQVFILLHKPLGYITTRKDPQGRPTVMDLVKEVAPSVYPVGRLDQFSTGLVLLTNDGEVAYVLTHPRYQVQKVYHVWTQHAVPQADQRKLRKGIRLADGMARAVQVRSLPKDPTGLELVLTEGRKHQIRRMLAALGHRVTRLMRTAIGPLHIGTLAPGQWRYLNPQEIQQLRDFVRERELKVLPDKPATMKPHRVTRPAPPFRT